jgi:hypothetical protein
MNITVYKKGNIEKGIYEMEFILATFSYGTFGCQ